MCAWHTSGMEKFVMPHTSTCSFYEHLHHFCKKEDNKGDEEDVELEEFHGCYHTSYQEEIEDVEDSDDSEEKFTSI